MEQVRKPPISRDLVMEMLKSGLKEFRRYSISLIKIPRWSKGRCFSVQNGTLFDIFTNSPDLNYLNLEEYSFYSISGTTIAAETFLLEELRHKPLLLEYSLRRTQICAPLLNISWHQNEAIKYCIEEERKYNVLMSLVRQWDPSKFRNFIDYRLRLHSSDFFSFFKCQPYLYIIMSCCADSHFVVQFFRSICMCLHEERTKFFNLLPNEYAVFFAEHLTHTDCSSVMREQWMMSEDLLLKGFVTQDTKLVRLALELNCPSVFLPPRNSVIPMDDVWPRKKDGIDPKSFNSCEYFVMFIDALIYASLEGNLQLHLTNCFRIIWRALPIPHLPIADMKKAINVFRYVFREVTEEGLSPTQTTRNRRTSEIWTLISVFFEEDKEQSFRPRTLQHLCRCAIRGRCRSPGNISRLRLPEKLQQYINLEF